MDTDEEEQEIPRGRGFGPVSMKTKILVLGAAYLGLLVGLLVVSTPLAMDQIGPRHSQEAKEVGFGIYLVSSGELVISDDDIVSYNETSHQIVLEETGITRIKQLGMIPVNGTGFVVMAGEQPIYTGAFWTPISSIDYHGVVVVIEVPVRDTVTFELGYPGSFPDSTDPRDDPRIFNVFRSLGKLVQ